VKPAAPVISRGFGLVETQAPGIATAGLLCLSLSLTLTSLPAAGLLRPGTALLGLGLFLSATGQILAGLALWRREEPLPTLLLSALGLFWYTRLACDLLPHSGLGALPPVAATSGLLLLWGGFVLILALDADILGTPLRLVLGLVAAALLLQGAAAATGLPLLAAIGGYCGLAAALGAAATDGGRSLCGGTPPRP